MNLFQIIPINYKFVLTDFTGFSINFLGVLNFFLNAILALSIFILFYLVGKKIREILFKESKQYVFFINIILGYIFIGLGFAILGIFSLLQEKVILTYLIFIILIGLYGFSFSRLKTIRININQPKKIIVSGVVLFVFISFLRLMTPEITEDAYHTDLPQFYLSSGSTIHETRDPLHVIPYPQLAEMIYIIPIFLGDKEAVRFIHFGFYLLIIFLLFSIAKKKQYDFVRFAPLLFVTAPIMIRYSSTQYVDFFMVFSFLLSVVLLNKNNSNKEIVLSGVIFGSVLSVKLWTLIYLPAVILFLIIVNREYKIVELFKKILLFISAALSIPLLWYIRAFIITGNPIYPIFTKIEYLEVNYQSGTFSYFGFNGNMFAIQNMIVYSPLFFVGIILFILYFRKSFKLLQSFGIGLFFLILMVEQLIVKVDLGRYLVAWYTFAIIIISAAISNAYKNIVIRSGLILLYLGIFMYYFINTLLILPYGLGWADKNAYLTRVLGRDNASYYDFDHLFNKWINKTDHVATYSIYGYYYANFSYIDVNYIFSKKDRSFDLIKKRQITKLLIKGGDIIWFCKQLELTNCRSEKVKLLATYPSEIKKYYLYQIR